MYLREGCWTNSTLEVLEREGETETETERFRWRWSRLDGPRLEEPLTSGEEEAASERLRSRS